MTWRKYIAVLLLAVFGLPLVLSSMALGQDPEAGLPACCRRHGQHHCSMLTADPSQAGAHDPQLQAPAERCPCCPATPVAAHPDPLVVPPSEFATVLVNSSQAGVVAQTESRYRIARDRSRQKRGPPQQLSL